MSHIHLALKTMFNRPLNNMEARRNLAHLKNCKGPLWPEGFASLKQ
jgi:hypothetical protein